MKMKYIFLDIDGTLVDYNGRMPDSSLRALQSAKEKGHALFLCTGRLKDQIYPWLIQAFPFDGIITSSGAGVWYRGEKLWSRTMSREELAAMIAVLDECRAGFVIQNENDLLVRAGGKPRIYDTFAKYSTIDKAGVDIIFEPALEIEGDLTALAGIEKSAYFDSGIDHAAMQARLGDRFRVDPYSYGQLPETCGEITPSDVSKAAAIGVLMQKLGGTPDDVIAIGDGGNDLPMLEYAGVGVAMGNACEELKAAADFITDDIDADGLAKAFVRLSLADESCLK